MTRYTKKQISDLRDMRQRGYSILQLMDVFSMPKTTVWNHVNGVTLSDTARALIKSRQGGSKQRSKNMWFAAEREASKLLKHKNTRDLSIKASMLYWAEGNKKSLAFTNTDPEMVLLFLSFLRSVLLVNNSRIKLLIRTSDPLNPGEMVGFWVKQTRVDYTNVSFNHDNKQNKTKSAHGICRLWVTKGGYNLKVIQCMINDLKRPRSSRDRTPHS